MTDHPAGGSHDATPTDDDQIIAEDLADVAEPDEPAARLRRPSKWDRPPPPKDWRYYVGGIGRGLIAIGLLMFGFVAYQLWGTGIETARAQDRLEDQFEQALEELPATTTTAAPTTTVVVETTPAPTTAATSPPTSPSTSPSTSPTTVPPTTPATSAPVEQPIPPIESGDVLARLEIPAIGKEGASALYVVPGVSVNDLKKGPGHYPDTPLPGQLGNSAIAGHRTTYGAPFNDIPDLAPGDEIRITMLTGDVFVYEVTGSEIVSPSDYHVVATTDPTVATLTLTTCHPEYTAKQRWIVHAVLKPQESAPVGEPTFYDLEDEERTESTESTESTQTVSPGTTEPSGSPTVTTQSTTTPPAVEEELTSTPPEPQADEADAFSEGWFHDSAAWPHIIGWGALLVLISVGSHWLSRRYRSTVIGVGAAAFPFVVCLYFFYQNVNRLLPPGL